MFKDRCKVKSLLKEGAHCFEMKQNVLFGERFQKKVSETIKSKTKTTEPLRNVPNPRQPNYLMGASIIQRLGVLPKKW